MDNHKSKCWSRLYLTRPLAHHMPHGEFTYTSRSLLLHHVTPHTDEHLSASTSSLCTVDTQLTINSWIMPANYSIDSLCMSVCLMWFLCIRRVEILEEALRADVLPRSVITSTVFHSG